jgi:hypothetical protein
MDFNQLMARMRELDQPTQEACGDSMSPPMPSPMNSEPPVPPPSMSVNLNASGMDNIEGLLKLMTKVNPDMINQPNKMAPPIPGLSADAPSIMSIKPAMPPLKMLPDFDADNDVKPGGEMDSDYNKDGQLDPHEKDHADEKPLLKTLDLDKDGDHDMDDHDMEKDRSSGDEKKEDGGFRSATTEPDEKYMGIDAAIPDGNDLNKPKRTFPKVAGGDNPMQRMEGTDLRAQIRAELQQRLAEAKQR